MKVLLFPVLLASGISYGQNLSLFGLTNNSGIFASINNPADGSGANEWLSVNVVSLGSSMESNVLRLDLDYSLVQMAAGQPKRQQLPAYTLPLYAVKENTPEKPVLNISSEVLLPSFRINPHQDISFFFYARDKVMGNISEIGADMIPLLMENRLPAVAGMPDLGIKVRMVGYRELALGASGVLWKRRNNYISGGVSIKRTLGRFAYLMEFGDFTATPQIGGARVSANYRLAATDLVSLYKTGNEHLSLGNAPGKGWGFDLGFIYEHRPNRFRQPYRKYNAKGKNRNFSQRAAVLYDYRIGVSVNVLGNITFKGNSVSDNTYRYEGDVKMGVPPDQAHQLKDWKEDSKVVSSSDSVTLTLPSSLNLFFDYRISENWFVNVSYSQNLLKREKIENVYTPTSINLLIRRETGQFTFGAPLRIVPQSRSVSLGFLVQTGPFFLGANNLALFFSRQVYNPSLYTGFCFRIRYKRDPTLETFKAFH